MNRTGSTICQCRWLGSKLNPKVFRWPIASSARCAVMMSNAISVRMHFQRELHAAFVKDVQDRIPHAREVPEPIFDHRIRHRRETVQQMPDGRAR